MMTESEEKQEYYCEVCGKEVSREEYDQNNGLCDECKDDRLTEEIDTVEGSNEEFLPM